MSNLRAAAQQALEALTNCGSEYGHRCTRCDSEIDEGGKVATALRAALAQEEQEPVAWLKTMYSGTRPMLEVDHLRKDTSTPVFTHPPRREQQRDELLAALRLIAATDPVDAALDPQRAVRVARAAIDKAEGKK
jgi:hypothetical protein